MAQEEFSVTVKATTREGLAAGLANLVKEFGGKVFEKVGKLQVSDEDAEIDTSDDESVGALDEGESEGTESAVTDDEIIKAFAGYAKRTDKKLGEGKGRAKAIALLKKLGYAKPVDIPADERESVIDKLA
jgi:hypothetical protein